MDLDFNMLSEYLLVDEDPSKLEILPHHKAISSQDPKGTAVVGHGNICNLCAFVIRPEITFIVFIRRYI